MTVTRSIARWVSAGFFTLALSVGVEIASHHAFATIQRSASAVTTSSITSTANTTSSGSATSDSTSSGAASSSTATVTFGDDNSGE